MDSRGAAGRPELPTPTASPEDREPSRWWRIEELFERALELEVGEREAFPREACAAEPELEREVAALLEADGRDDRSLDHPGIALAEHACAPRAEALEAGTRLGACRIDELAGSGGMGAV